MRPKPTRFLYRIGGLICFALGSVGILLPILPTVPFYLLAGYCFARSSEELYRWFLGTKLYRKHMHTLVHEKAMTLSSKYRVIVMVTVVCGIGYWMMDDSRVGQICLMSVWVCHLVYFIFKITTIKNE